MNRSEYRDRFNAPFDFHRDTFVAKERRLKAIDQADDNKINGMIKKQACNETPKSEGQ